MEGGQRPRVLVVADDERHVAAQLAGAVPIQQIDQAVLVARHEDRGLRPIRRVLDAVVDAEPIDERLERRRERRVGDVEPVEVELDAHEEAAAFVVAVLGGVEDVGAVLEQEARDRRDESLRVGAIDQKNGGVHGAMLSAAGRRPRRTGRAGRPGQPGERAGRERRAQAAGGLARVGRTRDRGRARTRSMPAIDTGLVR